MMAAALRVPAELLALVLAFVLPPPCHERRYAQCRARVRLVCPSWLAALRLVEKETDVPCGRCQWEAAVGCPHVCICAVHDASLLSLWTHAWHAVIKQCSNPTRLTGAHVAELPRLQARMRAHLPFCIMNHHRQKRDVDWLYILPGEDARKWWGAYRAYLGDDDDDDDMT